MALKRRIKKFTGSLKKLGTTKELFCKECNKELLLVASDIVAVTCARCVQKLVEPPVFITKKPEGEKFPRGWHFKQRYVHTDGRVFCKGVDTGEIDNSPKKVTKKKIVTKQVKKTKTKKKGK